MVDDFDPRDRDDDVRDIEMPWSNWGVVRALTEKRTTLAIALTTFVTEIVTSASGTTIARCLFSTISNCRADQNARSSSTAIIGMNSTAMTTGRSRRRGVSSGR